LDNQGGISDRYIAAVTDEERELLTHLLQLPGLPDYLQQAKGPTRWADVATRFDFTGFAAVHPAAKTFLTTPIRVRDELIGSLYLVEPADGPKFTDEDQAIAAMFAAQAGSTIANARRYEEARQAREDMERLMDLCPVAVSIFDARLGKMAYMNQEARRLMATITSSGANLDEVFTTSRFTRADGRELSFEELPGTRALQSGETVIAEEIVTHYSNGSSLTQLVSSIPIFSETGDIVSVLSASQDLTPLQDQELWRAEFLTMVSEELRTPLISIKGSAAALIGAIDTATSAENMQWLSIIDRQADLMRRQINSLIELTQIETGTLSLAAQRTNIAALIERSCQEYLRDHSAVSIRCEIPDGLPAVSADEQYIGKALHNFLRDVAMRAGDSSPITVSAEVIDIYVAIAISAEVATPPPERPSLRNNVSEDPQMFEDATRAHAKAVELATKGEGLAMGFCRGVIEAHGGRIRTKADDPDGKLTFTFTLPTVDDTEELGTPRAGETSDNQRPGPDSKTQILVSIQDPRSQRTVRQALLDSGYAAVEAAGLDEVEELASSEGPALIVLDIAGREDDAFRALRGAGNPRGLPAIVLCNRSDEEYVIHAFEMGADGYMVKPFSPSELIARIRATLRRLSAGGDTVAGRTFEAGDLRINFEDRTVSVSGQLATLTATEYKLLEELANGAGRVFTQDMLLQRVWGTEYYRDSQLLRSYIKSLRQKLGDNARKPTYIFTEHGIGYRMARSDAATDRPGLVSSALART